MKVLLLSLMLSGLMSAGEISTALTNSAQKGASPQTLWNFGLELYCREVFPTRETAAGLAQGYASAKGINEAQNAILKQAEAFWSKQRNYFDSNLLPAATYPDRTRFPSRALVRGFRSPPLPLFRAPRFDRQ
ncbi:MAG: hypothetical protein AB1641_09400 [Thermodesulfobacteriota bacterium]